PVRTFFRERQRNGTGIATADVTEAPAHVLKTDLALGAPEGEFGTLYVNPRFKNHTMIPAEVEEGAGDKKITYPVYAIAWQSEWDTQLLEHIDRLNSDLMKLKIVSEDQKEMAIS